MQLVRDWRTFQRLGADHRWLIVEAAALTGVVWLGLRTVSFARLRRALDVCSQRALPQSPTPLPAIGWAVNAAARRFPAKRTCLVEALAADVMLRRRQYRTALHLGVQKTTNRMRPLDGHAWVECNGVVVVGHLEDLAKYSGAVWTATRIARGFRL
jgi:Transglutaminase-like superfamily